MASLLAFMLVAAYLTFLGIQALLRRCESRGRRSGEGSTASPAAC